MIVGHRGGFLLDEKDNSYLWIDSMSRTKKVHITKLVKKGSILTISGANSKRKDRAHFAQNELASWRELETSRGGQILKHDFSSRQVAKGASKPITVSLELP
jgi:hypothetical protein